MDTIRRRRAVGLVILLLFIGFGVFVTGWQYSPVKLLIDVTAITQGTYTSGDPYSEWVYSYCDGNRQQVVVLQNDKLLGAEGLDKLRNANSPQRCDLPLVDHAELDNWNNLLKQLQEITRASNASGRDVLKAAMALPLSNLYVKPVKEWILAEPAHAVEYIDTASDITPDFDQGYLTYEATRRQNFSEMVEIALSQVTSTDLDPDRLERWLEADALEEHLDQLITLASTTDIDRVGKAQLLEKLDHVDNDRQASVYRNLGESLVSESAYASLLVEQLGELPRRERRDVARYMLNQPSVSESFISELIREFDDVFYGDEAELNAFIDIADTIKERPNSPSQLTTLLKDLGDIERRKAAIYLVSLDAADSDEFTLTVLYQFDKLHEMSRTKVMDAIMISPQFQRDAVQEASLNAIQFQMNGSERRDYLSKMLLYRNLDDGLKSRVTLALND